MNKNKELREILLENPDLEIKFLVSAIEEEDYPIYLEQNITKVEISDYLEVDGEIYTDSDDYGEYLCCEQDFPLEEAYKIAEALSNKVILVRLAV